MVPEQLDIHMPKKKKKKKKKLETKMTHIIKNNLKWIIDQKTKEEKKKKNKNTKKKKKKKKESRYRSCTLYKKQFKMDHRPKYKT